MSQANEAGDDHAITGQQMWITSGLQPGWICMWVRMRVHIGDSPQQRNRPKAYAAARGVFFYD